MTAMSSSKSRAAAEFRRMMKWIVVAAVVMVAGALWFAAATTELTLHMAIAMTAGVLLSVVLGSGLFALAFFSDKSGYDQTVTDASKVSKAPEHIKPPKDV